MKSSSINETHIYGSVLLTKANTREQKGLLDITLTTAAFCFMLFMQVFNMNANAAAAVFLMAPMLVAGFVCIVSPKKKSSIVPCVIVIVMVMFAAISTALSSIVGLSMDLLGLIAFAFLFCVMGSVNLKQYEIKKILSFYLGVVLLISFWIIVDWIAGGDSDGRASISYLGIRKDYNYLAAYLPAGVALFCLKAITEPGKRRRYVIFTAVVVVAIFFTGSRSNFLISLICVATLVIKEFLKGGLTGKKLGLLLGGILVFAALFVVLMNTTLAERMFGTDSYSNNIRLYLWQLALQGFQNNPVLGSGIQASTYYTMGQAYAFMASDGTSVQLVSKWVCHNCYIDIIAGQGVIGVGLFLALFLNLLKVSKDSKLFMLVMLFAYMAPLFFINGYESASFWMPLIMCKVLSDYCKEKQFQTLFN